MADTKEKKYVSDNARLMAEWNWNRNGDFTPSQLTLGSNKKLWWRCKDGHEWEASIYSRANGSGCPLCAKVARVKNNTRNQIEAKGSLATNFPELANEWDNNRNGMLTPADVLCGSTKKFGGDVLKDIAGKQEFPIGFQALDVRYVLKLLNPAFLNRQFFFT